MTNQKNLEFIDQLLENTPHAAKVKTLLNAKGRFVRVTMKPQKSDEKRGGKQRIFLLNCRATWRNHLLRQGSDIVHDPIALKGVITKLNKGMLTIVESARGEDGKSFSQCRTLNIPMIESIKDAGVVHNFV